MAPGIGLLFGALWAGLNLDDGDGDGDDGDGDDGDDAWRGTGARYAGRRWWVLPVGDGRLLPYRTWRPRVL